MAGQPTFATIPTSWLQSGKLHVLSNPALRIFLAGIGWAKREPTSEWDCGVDVQLRRGEWLMSRNELQAKSRITNTRSFGPALEELSPRGPHGFALLDWR